MLDINDLDARQAERLEYWQRRLGLALLAGNENAVRELSAIAIHEFARAAGGRADDPADVPLAEALGDGNVPLGKHVRLVNALEAHNILTVGDLLETDYALLMGIPNVASKTVCDAYRGLARFCLREARDAQAAAAC